MSPKVQNPLDQVVSGRQQSEPRARGVVEARGRRRCAHVRGGDRWVAGEAATAAARCGGEETRGRWRRGAD